MLLSLVFLLILKTSGAAARPGYEKKDWYLYFSFLLPQLGFALVAAFFFLRTKTPVKSAAGKCKAKYFLIAALLQIGLLSLSELNDLFLRFLGKFGYQSSEILLPSLSGAGLLGVLLTVAVLPAIFEETIFRGILLGGLKNFGTAAAVLLCGALFSLYHQNPAQTAYQFVCGAAFALVALRAGSILPTVLSHFLNNAFIILLSKFGVESFSASVKIPVLIVSALCLAGSLAYLIFWDKRRGTRPADGAEGKKEPADRKGFFLCAAVGIAICAVTWLASFASGLGG